MVMKNICLNDDGDGDNDDIRMVTTIIWAMRAVR